MKTIKQKIGIIFGLFSILFFFIPFYAQASEYGEDANIYTKQLIQQYETGSSMEEQSQALQNFLLDRISYMGYRPVEYPFSSVEEDTYIGKNIVFRRVGMSEREIILEACYKENPVGAGVLLEMANQLASQSELPYTVRFLLTDVETIQGTEQYLAQLTEEEKANIVAAISLSTMEGQDSIKLQMTEQEAYQWLGKQIQSIADQIKISIPMLTEESLIWEQWQIPHVRITISNTYSQLRNAAMLLDVWLGNASENTSTAMISEQYLSEHGAELQMNQLTFHGIPIEKVIGVIVMAACGACLLVFFFQIEYIIRKRKRRERY